MDETCVKLETLTRAGQVTDEIQTSVVPLIYVVNVPAIGHGLATNVFADVNYYGHCKESHFRLGMDAGLYRHGQG